MPEHQDYYKLLRVSKNATVEEIKKSFRRLARDCHPDLHPNDADAAERFRLLREAYEVLSDSDQRNRYDRRRQKAFSQTQNVNSPQVYYVRGVEKILMQDYQGAISALSEAIRLNTRFIEAYLKRCEAFLAVGEERAALEDCQRVLRYQPDSAIAHYYRGRARQRLGYTDSAIKAYTTAIRLDKQFAPSYYYRGVANYELRYRHRAIYDWREYADICKQQGDQQGYRLAMDTLSRYSWVSLKIGNRTLGQWWRWGKQKLDVSSQISQAQRFQLGKQLEKGFRETLTAIQLSLKALLETLFQVMKNPVGGLLPAYGRLEPKMVGVVSAGLITIAQFCLIFAMLSRFGGGITAVIAWFIIGTIPLLTLFLISLITRSLVQHFRHWTGDLFFASCAVLPLAFLLFLSAFSNLIPDVLFLMLIVFGFSHTILILYGGCSQFLNLSESLAASIIPAMVIITTLLTWVGLSILF